MPVDYDLALVGGTLTGRWAALTAAQMGARVGLIEPAGSLKNTGSAIDRCADRLSPELTAAGLAVHGVDVVLGQPIFEAVDPLRLQVGTRQLTARTGLLAVAGIARRYDLPGLVNVQPWHLAMLNDTSLPQRIALVGQQAATVEWALALAQRGIEVTVALPGAGILPTEDHDIQRLVTAQLRAMGVRLCRSPHFTVMGAGVEIRAAAAAPLRVDRVVLSDVGPPDLSALKVPSFGAGPLSVDAYLRTRHRRLYAVGAVLGGEDRLALAQAEATVAVENALFWRRRAMRYGQVHYSLTALTPVGRAGLTTHQAQQYGEGVETCQSGAAAEMTEAPVGDADLSGAYAVDFCKLVMAKGRLVGLHLMGDGAEVAIALLAPYLGQSPMRLLEPLAGPALNRGLAAQIARALSQYRADRWQPGAWRRDWAENWFNWRRSR